MTVTFSIREIPFSHHGSWFCFSPVVAQATCAEDVHLVWHRTGMHAVMKLVPDAPAATTSAPHLLTWRDGERLIELAYESAGTVRVRGRGLGLRLLAAEPALTPFSGPYFYQDPVDGSYVLTLYQTGRRYRITLLAGRAEHLGAQALGAAERGIRLSGAWEIAIEEYETARAPYTAGTPFDQVAEAARTEFGTFAEAVAP